MLMIFIFCSEINHLMMMDDIFDDDDCDGDDDNDDDDGDVMIIQVEEKLTIDSVREQLPMTEFF